MPLDRSELCAALLEAAPDAMLVADATGLIVMANQQTDRLFGYERQNLVGKSIEILIPEKYKKAHVEKREAYQSTPRTRPMGSGLEVTGVTQDGREFPAEVSLSPVNLGGELFVIAIIRDITERYETHAKLRFLSTHDQLTGLFNRTFFDEELARLGNGQRFPLSVVIIDIDGLKATNDGQGHEAGDALLKRAAALFRAAFRTHDIVARIGGDEFAVILPDTNALTCERVVERLKAVASDHNQKNTELEQIWFSIGWDTAQNPNELVERLRSADLAMYQNKRQQRSSLPPSFVRE